MTTIANFVVSANLDPGGIRQGLDQALGYTERFSRSADRLFASIGSERDGIAAAQRIVAGLKGELARAQSEIKEDLFRGFVDKPAAERQGQQVGLAFDQGVLRALDQLRGRAQTDRIFAAGLPKIEQTLVSALGTAGGRAGQAFNRSLGAELSKGPPGGVGGGGATSPIGSAIDALNRQSHIGAAGVGIIRRELIGLTAQLTQTLPLVDRLGASLLQFSGAGGANTFAIIAGITAIAAAYHFITQGAREAAEENKKALESIKGEIDALHQHISERALSAAEEQVRTAQAALNRITQQQGVRGTLSSGAQTLLPQITPVASDKEAAALREANTTLQAALQNRDKLRRDAKKSADDSYDGQLASLIKFNQATAAERRIANDRLKAYEKEAAALRESGADNERRVFVLAQAKDLRESLFPKAKTGDPEPFPELKRHIADLVATFADLRSEGAAPTIAMLTDAQAEFERLGRRIALLPDQTGRAARSLAELRRQLEPIVHMNEGALLHSPGPGEPQIPTADRGALTKQMNEQVTRVQALREAFGELDARVIQAQAGLSATFSRLAAATDAETDSTRIATDTLRAMAAARRELDAGAKAGFSEMFTPEMAQQLKQSIGDVDNFLKNLNNSGRSTGDVFDAIRTGIMGVIDAARGLGLISDDLARIGTSASHLVGALRQVRDVQKSRADAEKREAKTPGTGGAMAGILGTVSQIAAIGGAIGAGISLVSSVMGLFSRHDETLEKNNQALAELRLALVEQKGVRGDITMLQVIRDWAQGRGGFGGSSGNGNQGLDAALAAAGITLDEFNARAKALGIEFGKGLTWIDSFAHALELATAASTRFGTSLDDQRSLLDLHEKVFGVEDPNAKIADTIALLDRFAPALASMLEGFDTATEEGRAGLQTALQNIVTMIEQGAITPEQLGKLTGVKDLAGIILSVSDALGTMKKNVDDTNKAMSVNIPSWYKLGALRAMAADPMAPPITTGTTTTGGGFKPTPLTPPTQPLLPTLPQLDLAAQGSSTALAGLTQNADALSVALTQVQSGVQATTQFPQASDLRPYVPGPIDTSPLTPGSSSDGGSFTWYGDAYIDARSMSAAELFDTVMREGQRRAATRFRNTKDWARVQS